MFQLIQHRIRRSSIDGQLSRTVFVRTKQACRFLLQNRSQRDGYPATSGNLHCLLHSQSAWCSQSFGIPRMLLWHLDAHYNSLHLKHTYHFSSETISIRSRCEPLTRWRPVSPYESNVATPDSIASSESYTSSERISLLSSAKCAAHRGPENAGRCATRDSTRQFKPLHSPPAIICPIRRRALLSEIDRCEQFRRTGCSLGLSSPTPRAVDHYQRRN